MRELYIVEQFVHYTYNQSKWICVSPHDELKYINKFYRETVLSYTVRDTKIQNKEGLLDE